MNATQAQSPPQAGETYRCNSCGMELQVTKSCTCAHDDVVHFTCCGKALDKKDPVPKDL